MLFLWRRLIANSGGPGQMRGGQALDQAYADPLQRRDGRPGLQRLRPGAAARLRRRLPGLRGDVLPGPRGPTSRSCSSRACCRPASGSRAAPRWCARRSTHLVLARGDVFVATSGGGAGLGDPLLRDPERGRRRHRRRLRHARARQRDLRRRRSTARAVDEAATTARRAEIRARADRRRPRPARPRRRRRSASRWPGTTASWTCASCERATLADGRRQLARRRGAAARRRSPSATSELGMHGARPRREPRVSRCASTSARAARSSLGVDVATDDLETLKAAGSRHPRALPPPDPGPQLHPAGPPPAPSTPVPQGAGVGVEGSRDRRRLEPVRGW